MGLEHGLVVLSALTASAREEEGRVSRRVLRLQMLLARGVALSEEEREAPGALALPEVDGELEAGREPVAVHVDDLVGALEVRLGRLEVEADHAVADHALEAVGEVLVEDVLLAVEADGLVAEVALGDAKAGGWGKVLLLGEGHGRGRGWVVGGWGLDRLGSGHALDGAVSRGRGGGIFGGLKRKGKEMF